LDRPQDWFNCLPPYLGSPSYEALVSARQAPQAGSKSIFVCPSAKATSNPNFMAYAMNMYLSPWIRPNQHHLAEIAQPGLLVFMADGPGGYSSTVPSALAYSVAPRHSQCANLLFLDGHVAAYAGSYLGCGSGGIEQPDVHWQTGTAGVNQNPVP
jgi:prepilin-type processing-associated H-X9-DG protein